jgi:hypothetical protein
MDNQIVKCPECGQIIDPKRRTLHMLRKHPVQAAAVDNDPLIFYGVLSGEERWKATKNLKPSKAKDVIKQLVETRKTEKLLAKQAASVQDPSKPVAPKEPAKHV